MFLSLLDGFVLAKAFSDFGGRNGGSRRCNMPLPSLAAKEATWVLLTQLGSNTLQHFEAAKRLRSSNEFSYSQRSARCTGWQNTCQHTWHP